MDPTEVADRAKGELLFAEFDQLISMFMTGRCPPSMTLAYVLMKGHVCVYDGVLSYSKYMRSDASLIAEVTKLKKRFAQTAIDALTTMPIERWPTKTVLKKRIRFMNEMCEYLTRLSRPLVRMPTVGKMIMDCDFCRTMSDCHKSLRLLEINSRVSLPVALRLVILRKAASH